MHTSRPKLISALALLAGIFTTGSFADVRMPAIFGDHMVLQQALKLPVWGNADPGEVITVSAAGQQTMKTIAGQDGKWSVSLAPLEAGSKPFTMIVAGHNTLKFEDVLAGDVWVASGQSNMEFGLGNAHNAHEEIPKADHPLIRLFIVQKHPAYQPLDDVGAGKPAEPLVGHWCVCEPDTVAKEGGWDGFSAIAYFFGKEIQKSTDEPVGLIECPFGGMPVQAFTSIEALKANPDFSHYVADFEKERDSSEKLKAAYPQAKAEYDKQKAQWDKDYGVEYNKQVDEWNNQVRLANAAKTAFPPKPKPAVAAPKPPEDGQPKPNTASNLFNGMIHPIIPFGITGVIWYQGESNTGAPWDYDKLFATLIGDWRARWKEGDFPFLYVQLANYMDPQKTPVEKSGYAVVRDMQLRTLQVKATGMAVAIDVGEARDIHPRDKADVGHRLALAARYMAYGEKIPYSGPVYKSMEVEGNKVRIFFKHADSGLKIGAHPQIYANETPTVPSELAAFAIAGSDRQWVAAKAVIDGSSVVVGSDQVKNPVAVRYGWANNPDCHLYNSEGLPASPFRTDDWPDPQPPSKPAQTTPAAVKN